MGLGGIRRLKNMMKTSTSPDYQGGVEAGASHATSCEAEELARPGGHRGDFSPLGMAVGRRPEDGEQRGRME